MSSECVVHARGLTHDFRDGAGTKRILDAVDLSVQRGEVVLLTGPSGSGKSTLLSLLGALRSVQGGRLSVLAQDLHGMRSRAIERLRAQIGFVFQAHHLLPSLSALDNVRMGLNPYQRIRGREASERAIQALRAVGLAEAANRRPGELSGGQRQRVAAARALVRAPKLLLADEPTASLDAAAGRGVVDRLRDIAKLRNAALVIVTHDARVLDVADRVYRLDEGAIAEV